MGRGRMTTTKQTPKATSNKTDIYIYIYIKHLLVTKRGWGSMLPKLGPGGIDLNSALVGWCGVRGFRSGLLS